MGQEKKGLSDLLLDMKLLNHGVQLMMDRKEIKIKNQHH